MRGVSLYVAFVRDAAWLTPARVSAYSSAMIVVSTAIVIWALTGAGLDDPAGRAVGTDFVSFWTVSWALLNGRQDAIYVPTALAALEQAVVPRADPAFYAWQYPPIALMVVYPLALLPYLSALAAWLIAGLAGYLSALWRILPNRQVLWAGLGFPAVLLTITHGQNSFLTTALLAWALILLQDKPTIAGVLMGMLSFKPQLALLLPIAMIAGGNWRALCVALLTTVGLAAATIILYGAEIWRDFVANAAFSRAMLDAGLVPYFKLQSVFAAIRLAGGGLVLAYAVQTLAALGAALVIAWIWRHSRDPDTTHASVLAATPLATPFLLDYDLMVLAPAIVWTMRRSIRRGALPWERVTLGLTAVLALVSRPLAECSHILLTPVVVAALLAVIAAREHHGAGNAEPPRNRESGEPVEVGCRVNRAADCLAGSPAPVAGSTHKAGLYKTPMGA